MAKKEWCYLTRDTIGSRVEVYPADVGIRVFHGCSVFGAAHNKDNATVWISPRKSAPRLTFQECLARFDFVPPRGTAWDIDGDKIKQVHLAFSG